MYIIYTIIILLSGANFFLCPPQYQNYIPAFREFILILIVIFSVFKIMIKKHNEKIHWAQIFALLYVLLIIVYIPISTKTDRLVIDMLAYITGPLIFCVTPYYFNSHLKIKKTLQELLNIFFIYLIINLIILPFQSLMLLISRSNLQNFYRYHSDGSISIRFTGLFFMPTVMGWFCIVLLLFPFHGIIRRLLSFVAFYLTDTRLFFPSLASAFYLSIKRKYQVLIFFPLILFMGWLVIHYLNNIDVSLVIHLDDLFFHGPRLVLEYLMGAGFVGTKLKVESDIYMISIQFGILGILIYISIFFCLIGFFNKKILRNNKIMSYGINLIVVFFVGSWFLPLTSGRVLANLFWIIISLIYSYGKTILREKKHITPRILI